MSLYKPAVVVVAFNRVEALKRLLSSLAKADYPDQQVPLVISIDNDQNRNKDVVEAANSFQWTHGEKKVIYQETNLGLRAHILKCGDLTQEYGSIVLLEDDLFVSPMFYRFASEALNYYSDDARIAGASLYSIATNTFARLPFTPMEDGSDVFFINQPCSWGQAWADNQWIQFRNWVDNNPPLAEEDYLYPESVKHWSPHSWLKFYIKFLAENGKYFVYPRVSMSTNFGDAGTNFGIPRYTVFQVKLQVGKDPFRFRPIDESLAVYDAYMELEKQALDRIVPELAPYDYTVDMYGIKPLERFDCSHVITTQPVQQSIRSFGMQLKPFEMNLFCGLEGNKIHLADKAHIQMDQSYALQKYLYFYSNVPERVIKHLYKNSFKLKVQRRLKWLK
ncbi:MAG: glycosyltransferase [Bacteroidota bacterium]